MKNITILLVSIIIMGFFLGSCTKEETEDSSPVVIEYVTYTLDLFSSDGIKDAYIPDEMIVSVNKQQRKEDYILKLKKGKKIYMRTEFNNCFEAYVTLKNERGEVVHEWKKILSEGSHQYMTHSFSFTTN